MSNGPKKITDLPIATTAAATDRLLFVQNAAGTPNTVTITLSNFANAILQTSLPAANATSPGVVIVGNNLTINATGYMSVLPASPNSSIQYNSSNSLGGSATFTYNVAGDAVTGNNFIGTYFTTGNSTQFNQIGFNSTYGSLAQFGGNQNNYAEVVVYNTNTGNQTSTDFIVFDNNGILSYNFADFGILGSNWSNSTWTINNPSDAYLYSANTNLSIGVASIGGATNYVNFFTGGSLAANERMRIDAGGNVNIGNTSGTTTLTIGNSTINVVANSTTLKLGVINSTAVGTVVSNNLIRVGNTNTYANLYVDSANGATLLLGNSTVYTASNATHFFSGNSTVYAYGNSIYEVLYNGTGAWSQTVVTAANVSVGNSTVYGFGNSTAELLYTTTAQTVMTATTMSVGGNTTAQTYINSTAVLVGNSTAGLVNTYQATVVSNTLTLGTSTAAANGSTYLPNGFKLNWGWVSANSTVGAVTFTSAYTTNAYVVTATSNTTVATYQPAVTAWIKTGATILTANATSTNVFWTAIGT